MSVWLSNDLVANESDECVDMASVWITPPPCSRMEIDRAGLALVSGLQEERDKAIPIVNAWRASHSFPLNTFQVNLRVRARALDPKAIVAQRLKRLKSIEAKLSREPHMKLSQMQDLGGCRAVVGRVASVSNLAAQYEADGYRIRNNYIDRPKPDGYRGIHVVGRYHTESKPHSVWNGHRVEIQLRTRLQHAWATAVETVTTFTGQGLKFGTGEEAWRRFFALMGAALAAREGTAIVEGTPTDAKERVDELRDLAKQLRVVASLNTWRKTLRTLPRRNTSRATSYLLILDLDKRAISVRGYKTARSASTDYALYEKAVSRQSKRLDVVQVSATSVDELRRLYPNYYSDTQAFILAFRRATR